MDLTCRVQLTIPISRLAIFLTCWVLDELEAFLDSFNGDFDLCLLSSCDVIDCCASLSVAFVDDFAVDSSRCDKFLLLFAKLLLFS